MTKFAAVGWSQELIAHYLRIAKATLQVHYADEYRRGKMGADLRVGIRPVKRSNRRPETPDDGYFCDLVDESSHGLEGDRAGRAC